MSFGTTVPQRIAEAIITGILSVILIVFARALSQTTTIVGTTPFSVEFYLSFMNSLPGIITLIAIIGATVIAGPFGFAGAVFETFGVNQILTPDVSGGFDLLIFGAILVAVGELIPWLRVIQWFLGSDRL